VVEGVEDVGLIDFGDSATVVPHLEARQSPEPGRDDLDAQ
jgi:hypothetical protein